MNQPDSSPAAWLSEGKRLLLAGDFRRALLAFNNALALDPTLADAWRDKGVALQELGRCQEAVENFDQALKIDRRDGEAWSCKGLALFCLGRHEEAVEAYGRALEMNPEDRLAWVNKGEALRLLGDYEEAAKCCLNGHRPQSSGSQGLEQHGRYPPPAAQARGGCGGLQQVHRAGSRRRLGLDEQRSRLPGYGKGRSSFALLRQGHRDKC